MHKDLRAVRGRRDPLESRAHKDLRAPRVQMVRTVPMVSRVNKDHKDLLENRAHKDQRVPTEQTEHMVPMASRALRGLRVP